MERVIKGSGVIKPLSLGTITLVLTIWMNFACKAVRASRSRKQENSFTKKLHSLEIAYITIPSLASFLLVEAYKKSFKCSILTSLCLVERIINRSGRIILYHFETGQPMQYINKQPRFRARKHVSEILSTWIEAFERYHGCTHSHDRYLLFFVINKNEDFPH